MTPDDRAASAAARFMAAIDALVDAIPEAEHQAVIGRIFDVLGQQEVPVSSAMDDVFGQNSNRPDHPDYWRLSEIILGMDGAIEAAPDVETKDAVWHQRVRDVIDEESGVYASVNRSMLLVNSLPFDIPDAVRVQLTTSMAGLWMDAFVTGAQFVEREWQAREKS